MGKGLKGLLHYQGIELKGHVCGAAVEIESQSRTDRCTPLFFYEQGLGDAVEKPSQVLL